MPENFRALIAVLVLSLPTWRWLRPRLTAVAIDPSDYRVRAGLWVAVTLALFLSHNFWLFVLVLALGVLWASAKDSHPLGLYCFLLFAAPAFHRTIPGVGSIAFILSVDYLRVLSAFLLLPLALRLARSHHTPGIFRLPSDKFVVAYLVLNVVLQAPVTSVTDSLRAIVGYLLDVVLPYFVFSRGLDSIEKFRDALGSFVAAAVVLSVIGVFETGKGWLLYSMLGDVLNATWGFGSYMMREGALRASASVGHSIVFGYVLVAALGMLFALRSSFPTRRSWLIALCVIGAGIVASGSRGPWVGAAVVLAVVALMSPDVTARLGKLAVLSVVLVPVIMLTPIGGRIISVLPFIGSADGGSVTYRQQLFTVSWRVIMMNPLLGSPHYMLNPELEQMRQGEGIIDIVNSYIGIALYSGFLGLALFAGAFLPTLARLFGHLRLIRSSDSEAFALGLGLAAALTGVLVMIATLSSVDVVPVVYWSLAGACAAYVYRESLANASTEFAFARPPMAPHANGR